MKRKALIAKVTKRGLIVPKSMLAEAEEVEIRKEDHRIVISPISKTDPIFSLGKHPVNCGLPDGSERHDNYLYGPRS
jgi:hypothetical protein